MGRFFFIVKAAAKLLINATVLCHVKVREVAARQEMGPKNKHKATYTGSNYGK